MKLLYRLFCITYRIQRWLFKRFTPGGLSILICLFAAAIIGLDTKQTMAYQIFTFLLAVLIIAIAFSFYFPIRFTAVRSLPRFATVGVKLSYQIVFTNKTRQKQTGLRFIEEITYNRVNLSSFKLIARSSPPKQQFRSLTYIYTRWLKAIARRQKVKVKTISLPSLKPQHQTAIKAEITPTHRGVVKLAGITLLRPDPFNLFNATKTIALPQSLLALPQRYQLPKINLAGSRMFQSGNVVAASSVGDSQEFNSLRDYRPGDPLRKIHWKSWAKTGKPVVREEQSEFLVRHALILDTFQAQNHSEELEFAISVAASFACNLHTQESLLDLMFVAQDSYCFTSGRGLGNSEQMLEILAEVTACQDLTFASLATAVKQRISMMSSCICVLITWDDARRELIQQLQRFNIPLLTLLIAESEQQFGDLNLANLYVLPKDKIQESLMKIDL